MCVKKGFFFFFFYRGINFMESGQTLVYILVGNQR